MNALTFLGFPAQAAYAAYAGRGFSRFQSY